jgi:hypothetical protein
MKNLWAVVGKERGMNCEKWSKIKHVGLSEREFQSSRNFAGIYSRWHWSNKVAPKAFQFSEHGSLKLLVSLLLSIQVTEKESAIVKGEESWTRTHSRGRACKEIGRREAGQFYQWTVTTTFQLRVHSRELNLLFNSFFFSEILSTFIFWCADDLLDWIYI